MQDLVQGTMAYAPRSAVSRTPCLVLFLNELWALFAAAARACMSWVRVVTREVRAFRVVYRRPGVPGECRRWRSPSDEVCSRRFSRGGGARLAADASGNGRRWRRRRRSSDEAGLSWREAWNATLPRHAGFGSHSGRRFTYFTLAYSQCTCFVLLDRFAVSYSPWKRVIQIGTRWMFDSFHTKNRSNFFNHPFCHDLGPLS